MIFRLNRSKRIIFIMRYKWFCKNIGNFQFKGILTPIKFVYIRQIKIKIRYAFWYL